MRPLTRFDCTAMDHPLSMRRGLEVPGVKVQGIEPLLPKWLATREYRDGRAEFFLVESWFVWACICRNTGEDDYAYPNDVVAGREQHAWLSSNELTGVARVALTGVLDVHAVREAAVVVSHRELADLVVTALGPHRTWR